MYISENFTKFTVSPENFTNLTVKQIYREKNVINFRNYNVKMEKTVKTVITDVTLKNALRTLFSEE